ncbi:MAG: hydrogenase maturation nickel metallochaperone HypA [Pseudomonadales bacterium]|nr:hydrogenase maturation nickel metallochaperone HypA [Pseudomonadales bacterium]
MHEVSLCEDILQIMCDAAREQHFTHVLKVKLAIGELSCVEAEALTFCFQSVCKGTLAESAELEIVAIPGKATCGDCGQTSVIETRYDPCPHCGGIAMNIVQGDEMKINALEVE